MLKIAITQTTVEALQYFLSTLASVIVQLQHVGFLQYLVK
jgi:hypothetical protein